MQNLRSMGGSAAHYTSLEASMAPAFPLKSAQSGVIQMHQVPSWKRYESEEEDVSETSSQSVRSSTECSYDDEYTEESTRGVESFQTQPPSPSRSDSSSIYSQRLSIITAKHASVVYQQDQDTMSDGKDVSPCAEYVTPPLTPIYLEPVCYVPEGSKEFHTEKKPMLDDEDNEGEEARELEWQEVFEATQIVFTAPTSRPSIVTIHSPTTGAILSARMGHPISPSDEQENSNGRPLNIQKRPSTKRSLSASGLSPSEQPKRFSAMFNRDMDQAGETRYVDSQSHARTQSSEGRDRSRSRARASPREKKPSSIAEPPAEQQRQSRLRRNPSQRSSRSTRCTPDYEGPRNYSRPRCISGASDNTSASSASWKNIHSRNWSNASLQQSSSSSIDPSPPSTATTTSSSLAALQNEAEVAKPAAHPLSIITTVTSPTLFSAPDNTTFPSQSHSAIIDRNEIEWSPIEQRNYSYNNRTQPKTFPYSRSRNPSLSFLPYSGEEDAEPAMTYSRPRKSSTASSMFVSSRKSSISTSGSGSGSGSGSSSTMKMLMGGFRGLSRPRGRQ